MALVDLMMPIMDGAQTCQVLRGLDSELKIVAMTGQAESDMISSLTGSGTLVLLKPFDGPALRDALADA